GREGTRSAQRGAPACASVDLQQFDLELQRRVRWDVLAGTVRAIPHGGRDDELPDAADPHALDALIPPIDDFTLAERELERLAVIARAVELEAVQQRPGVM